MEWSNEIPEKDGKYIVKTVSTVLKTETVMYAILHTNEKGHKIWSFKNQLFKSYLKGKSKEEIIDEWVNRNKARIDENDIINLRRELNSLSIETLRENFQNNDKKQKI